MEILRNNSDDILDTENLQVITKLSPAVKNEKRVNVFVNDKFAFSLDVAQVVDLKVKVGMKLSEADLLRFRKASNFGKLYQRTLEWVLTRPRSVRETYDYLRKKKFNKPEYEISDEDIEAVVVRLQEKKYLDDQKFAEYYVENRFLKKGVSTKRLKMELAKKGVAEELTVRALAQVGRDDREELRKMITRKRARYTDEKLIAYLVRQGFDFELVRSEVLGKD